MSGRFVIVGIVMPTYQRIGAGKMVINKIILNHFSPARLKKFARFTDIGASSSNNILERTPVHDGFERLKAAGKSFYTRELELDSNTRHIDYFNDKNQKIKTTDIKFNPDMRKTVQQILDPETGDITAIETERTNRKNSQKVVQKCEINTDPEGLATGKIIKYEMIIDDKPILLFERDTDGYVTRFVDKNGKECKADPDKYPEAEITENGKTEKVKYFDFAHKISKCVKRNMNINMKNYF